MDYPLSYLVDVDDGLPEVVLLLVEATVKSAQARSSRRGGSGVDLLSHTNLTEETRVVLVDVGSVVVLTTGHTTTTWVLPVLANATLTGGDVAAAVEKKNQVSFWSRPRFFFLLGLLSWAPWGRFIGRSVRHSSRSQLVAGVYIRSFV